MKKLTFLTVLSLLVFGLAGCIPSNQENNTVEQPTLPSEESLVEAKIQTTLSQEAIEAIAHIYGNDYTTLNQSYQLGDYVITDADDNSGGPGSTIQIVMGKFNSTWLPLYGGNSGEISCKIVSKFLFPQILLDTYGTICLEESDFTIPDEAYEYYIISSLRQSQTIREYLKSLCYSETACTQEEFNALPYTITNNGDTQNRTEFTITFSETEQYTYDTPSYTFYRIRPIDGGREAITL